MERAIIGSGRMDFFLLNLAAIRFALLNKVVSGGMDK
jgi:hypothetical protein